MSRRFLTTLATSALALCLSCSAYASSDYLNTTDTNFMRHAAADGVAEIQMGQLALEKSSDPQVKALAQRIVSDHTKADGEIRALALRKHVMLPATPLPEASEKAAELKQMTGKDFDRAWSAETVQDHHKAIDLFTSEGQQAKDADVRKFATTTTPVLQTHLQMAEALTGGSSMTPANNGQ